MPLVPPQAKFMTVIRANIPRTVMCLTIIALCSASIVSSSQVGQSLGAATDATKWPAVVTPVPNHQYLIGPNSLARVVSLSLWYQTQANTKWSDQ